MKKKNQMYLLVVLIILKNQKQNNIKFIKCQNMSNKTYFDVSLIGFILILKFHETGCELFDELIYQIKKTLIYFKKVLLNYAFNSKGLHFE